MAPVAVSEELGEPLVKAPDCPDSCPPLGLDGIDALAWVLPRLAWGARWAPGSHRESSTAMAEKLADHQNATWNASACVAACAAMALWRITARTAVPNAPPICCAVLVSTLECGIWWLSRPM